MRALPYLMTAFSVAGCADVRSCAPASDVPPRANERVIVAARRLAEDIDAGLCVPWTNEWRGVVCREELIGAWRATEICDCFAYDYDDAKESFRPSRAMASLATAHEFELFSDGRCEERLQSDARHFKLDLQNGMWMYSKGVLKMTWTRPKIDICYHVYRLDTGDVVLQKDGLPHQRNAKLFFDEEYHDRRGCRRQIKSATGWYWTGTVSRPIVAHCIDELDRKKFSDVIDRCRRETDLRRLVEAGVLSQEDFESEMQKLKGWK